MRVLVAALLLLVACERDGQPQLWRPPHVGDRSTGFLKFTSNLQGPDGRTHALMNESDFNAEQITFGIKTVGKLDGIGATLEATGTLRVFRGGKELTQDGELKRDGKRIGDLHVEQRSRPL